MSSSTLPSERAGAGRILAAVAVAAVAVWAAGALLEMATLRYDFSEPKVVESLALQNQQLDAVFLGSSVVEEGVDARAIDETLSTHTYNLAFGGASILSSELQLRQFLTHNPKPKLVVLGLYIDQPEQSAGILPTLYFGLSRPLRDFYKQRLLADEGTPLDRGFEVFSRIPAFRYRAVIDLLIKAAASKEDQRPRFVQGQARVGFSRQPVVIGVRVHDSALSLVGLRHFLEFCSEQGLRVFLFEPPTHPGYSALTRDRAQMLTQVNDLLRGDANVTFQSFNDDAIAYQPSDWVNLNHLNERGAKKLSARLAQSIAPLLR
jgi:hypothetical protein